MTFCMDATTGDDRHDEIRHADYLVDRTESSVSANWCGSCLLDYIEAGMGDCLIYVTRVRPAKTSEEQAAHAHVVTELEKLGKTCK